MKLFCMSLQAGDAVSEIPRPVAGPTSCAAREPSLEGSGPGLAPVDCAHLPLRGNNREALASPFPGSWRPT